MNNKIPNHYIIQLPNDSVSAGYKNVSPFHFEQVFYSASEDFTGTEREFFSVGKAYAYFQIDKHKRHTITAS